MRRFAVLTAAITTLFAVTSAVAQEYGTAKEAEAMVKTAVTHVKTVGKDQA